MFVTKNGKQGCREISRVPDVLAMQATRTKGEIIVLTANHMLTGSMMSCVRSVHNSSGTRQTFSVPLETILGETETIMLNLESSSLHLYWNHINSSRWIVRTVLLLGLCCLFQFQKHLSCLFIVLNYVCPNTAMYKTGRNNARLDHYLLVLVIVVL